ncbi:serine/threonine-protein kinase [Acrasis kona]|uniref:Serine/threonine-protein kinase n=1 Tax=Acrasis kona TaxID=1008807 RepID=A0AAW2YLG8_9EUKA
MLVVKLLIITSVLIYCQDIRKQSIITKGDYATIYFGHLNEEIVCLKSFKDPLALDREVEDLQLLNHTNIIRFIGRHSVDGVDMLVMEYMPTNLNKVIHGEAKNNLTLGQKVELLRDVAKALLYLSENDKYHGDLKPSNILLSVDGDSIKTKLCDFSDSKFRRTFMYMCPENYQYGYKFSYLCDIYSFGMIMYEVLFEIKPFSHVPDDSDVFKNVFEWKQQVLEGRRPYIPTIHSTDYINIMTRCWQSDPSKRPTYQEIIDNLK